MELVTETENTWWKFQKKRFIRYLETRTSGIWKPLYCSLRGHCRRCTPSWRWACTPSSQRTSLSARKSRDLYPALFSYHPPLGLSWKSINEKWTKYRCALLACSYHQSCNPCKWDPWDPCPSCPPPPGRGSPCAAPCWARPPFPSWQGPRLPGLQAVASACLDILVIYLSNVKN